MSQVRRLEQLPAAQTAALADQIAIWQAGRTRVATLADLVAFFVAQVPQIIPAGPAITFISDADYAVLPTDQTVGFNILTASRQVGLPQAPLVAAGYSVRVGDFRGFCSPIRKITIVAPFGGTINGQSSVEIQDAYNSLCLLHVGFNAWVIL